MRLFSVPRKLLSMFRNAFMFRIFQAEKQLLSNKNKQSILPGWYNNSISPGILNRLSDVRPAILYLPWIAEHGDSIVSSLADSEAYQLIPFDIVNGVFPGRSRKDIFRYARINPCRYRSMVAKRLVQFKPYIKAFIFTFDWPSVTRTIVSVCSDLDIPTILVPHESVFIDKDKYYRCPWSQSSVPLCDIVLAWGEMQKSIFVERGYPDSRIKIVGTPKFDKCIDYAPVLTRRQFCKIHNLSEEKKIILFACQPLDSQINTTLARRAQAEAISDLLEFSMRNSYQLIVRMPPSGDNVLPASLKNELISSDISFVDEATLYMCGPQEAIYHSYVVASLNSTMLFEALRYLDFVSFWDEVGIPVVHNSHELSNALLGLSALDSSSFWKNPESLCWASRYLGNGSLDSGASSRISQILELFIQGRLHFSQYSLGLYPETDDEVNWGCFG